MVNFRLGSYSSLVILKKLIRTKFYFIVSVMVALATIFFVFPETYEAYINMPKELKIATASDVV